MMSSLLLASLAIASPLTAPPQTAPRDDTPAEHNARMKWWREARLGMFVHWGLYAIPAGKWNGNTGHGEWIRETAQIPLETYNQFQSQFNPVKFDADKWVLSAKRAGMKYIVITSKHHDGFALFDSKWTDWDVMNTPFRRDIMKELAAAGKRHGVRICWYHSIMDWHHPDYLPRRSWEVAKRPADGADFSRFVTYLHNQVTELLTNYGDIGVMWFDGEWENTWTRPLGVDLFDLCRRLQPNIIVNNRVGPGRSGMEAYGMDERHVGDFSTPEQFIPPTGLPGQDWETCMTMNNNWGYNAADNNWKSGQDLVRKIVDIASKGGNYLLNVGPRADGTFPPEAEDRLAHIGRWMARYGNSIYGSEASRFDNLPWGRSTTKVGRQRTTIYLQVFDWPKDGRLVVPGIGNVPVSASVMGRRALVPVRRDGGDLVLQLPRTAPDPDVSVVELVVQGKPVIYRAPTIEAPSSEFIRPIEVKVNGGEGMTLRFTLDGSAPGPSSPEAKGTVRIDRTATLSVATFHQGRRASAVVRETFRKADPLPGAQVPPGDLRLAVEEFTGAFSSVKEIAARAPSGRTMADALGIPMNGAVPTENVGRRFRGWLSVPNDDVYVFELTSDDGATLLMGDRTVVDNDGLHSAQAKRGSIALGRGWHRYEVLWFNRTGGAALNLRWAPVGQELTPVR